MKCKVCKRIKSFSQYNRNDKGKLNSLCKKCDKLDKNKVLRGMLNDKNDYRLSKYNLTYEEHTAFVIKQNNTCAICKTPPHDDTFLSIDHDHETGRVRGLLCSSCNLRLGFLEKILKDNLLSESLAYLNSDEYTYVIKVSEKRV